MTTKGIQYVTDESGNRTGVLISLDTFGDVWEDVYDILVSHARLKESKVKWEDLKAEREHEKKTHGRDV